MRGGRRGLSEIVGVILAAGKGTRMLPFTKRWPKPVLPILGKALVRHQVEMMRGLGVQKVFVVVGHLGHEVARALGDGVEGVAVEYVEQAETLGIAHALGRLEGRIHGPLLLCLGDVHVVSSRLGEMLALHADGARAVLASKVEPDPEMIRRNFVIVADADGRARRVIEKPRGDYGRLKGCGLYLFGPEVFDAIRRTPRSAMRDEYEITDSIQIMIDDGHRVVHAPVVDDDLNLTVPGDLLAVNLAELRRLGLANYFAEEPARGEWSNFSGVVGGAGVTLGHGATLVRCVLFDGVVVPDGTELTDAIVTPGEVIPCRPTTLPPGPMGSP